MCVCCVCTCVRTSREGRLICVCAALGVARPLHGALLHWLRLHICVVARKGVTMCPWTPDSYTLNVYCDRHVRTRSHGHQDLDVRDAIVHLGGQLPRAISARGQGTLYSYTTVFVQHPSHTETSCTPREVGADGTGDRAVRSAQVMGTRRRGEQSRFPSHHGLRHGPSRGGPCRSMHGRVACV
mgnify:CR=1 FL=1